MQPPAFSDLLQEVHDSMTEMVKLVAREPSVGLYFVQQHVHKAVPGLVSLKSQVTEGALEATLYTEDLKDALSSVKSMKECGPPVINKMIKTLNSSLPLLPLICYPKGKRTSPTGYTNFLRAATHPSEATGVLGQLKDMPATSVRGKTEYPPANDSNSSAVIEGKPQASVGPPSTERDSSGYVSTLLGSAFQRASSVARRSVTTTTESNFTTVDSDPTPGTFQKQMSEPNLDKIPSRTVRSVLESAMQRAGNMVGVVGISSAVGSPDNGDPSLVHSSSAATLREVSESKPARYMRAVSAVLRAEGAGRGGSKFPRGANDEQLSEGQLRSTETAEGQLKFADWLHLPSKALWKLSKKEESEAQVVGEPMGSEGSGDVQREGEDFKLIELDLEDPKVLESYEKLRAEHAAKLEAWLGDSKEGSCE